MGRDEGGRWDVGIRDNAVHLERVSESDERLFDDSMTPEEARDLAGLLMKYADKLDESEDTNDSKDAKDSKDADDSEDSEDSDDSNDSADSEDSNDSADAKDSD